MTADEQTVIREYENEQFRLHNYQEDSGFTSSQQIQNTDS